MIKYNKIRLIFAIIMIPLLLSGCSNSIFNDNKATMPPIVFPTIQPTVIELSAEEKLNNALKARGFELENLKEDIKIKINDDIWYNGKTSNFSGFANAKYNIDIYLEKQESESECEYVDVLFKKEPKDYLKGGEYNYISFYKTSFHKLSISSYLSRNTQEETETDGQLNNKDRKIFCGETSIEFGKVTQPQYSALDDNKKILLNKIVECVKEYINSYFYTDKKGVFKIYIRNFRNFEDKTNVVIESNKGKIWTLDIIFNLDNTVIGGRVDIEENDSYRVKQYKKVAVLVKTIVID